MTAGHDPVLREAWNRFCDDLKSVGDIIFRETAASNPVDRAAGIRLLSRNIALASSAFAAFRRLSGPHSARRRRLRNNSLRTRGAMASRS